MNYCDKIHYNIYTTGLATFGEMVDALLAQLPQDEQILPFGIPSACRTTTNNTFPVASCCVRKSVSFMEIMNRY